jgi:hypothetical protein
MPGSTRRADDTCAASRLAPSSGSLRSTLTDGTARPQRIIRACKSLQNISFFFSKPQADLRKTFATSFLER